MSDERIARDWLTIWASEVAAVAEDPEFTELWQRGYAAWARAYQALNPTLDELATRSNATPRTAATAAASDARDGTVEPDSDALAELG